MIAAVRRRCALVLFASTLGLAAPALADELADGFADPPQSARPRVWWHWMNGNVTKDGIAKDIAWMVRSGIGGLQNFDASLTTPQIVAKRLVYMDEGWKDAFAYAVQLAEQNGLEFAIAASPGWSETGGPWVQPRDAVKKLVWSETIVPGGRHFAGKLAPPPSTTGAFGDAALVDFAAMIAGGEPKPPQTFYADAAVVAYPAAPPSTALPVVRTGEGEPLDAALLEDASFETGVELAAGTPGAVRSVELSFPTARTIHSATLFIPRALPPFSDPFITPILEVREGGGWRALADFQLGEAPTTVSFAPVTAREFRVVIAPYRGQKRAGLGQATPGVALTSPFPPANPDLALRIADLRLHEQAKIHRYETKAGFSIARDYHALSAGVPDAPGVAPEQVIDLTARMRPDGTLDWTPPKGSWRVVRFGYSLTGKTNHPATAEATGLEVDKLDAAAVRAYLETYLGMYRDAAGADMVGTRGVRALLTDSTEVGTFNWTPRMVAQFRRLRGYDPMPWLPTLTGTIVGTRADSDRFLYDFRRTLADLHASEHYGTIARVAHENGLKVYGEALEDVRPSLGDDIAMRRFADVPMAALWTWNRGDAPRPTLIGDMRGAASVAHLYGQNLVAAESMTAASSPWAFAPSDLRRVIDLEFAHGINRPVIHTSVHQPVDDKVPGLALMIFGQYFNRHETWAEMARPWIDYIARNAFLLQQGRNVADVAWFYGEDAPLTALFGQGPPADLPARHAYDFVNADALLDLLKLDGGELAAPSGARYRALYLGGSSARMTLPVLRRIAELAEGGATIVGSPPSASPSLKDDPQAFAALARRLWAGGAVTQVGRGRVIAGNDIEAALDRAGIAPDFAYAKPRPDSEVLFVHRTLDAKDGGGDLYFVNNRAERAETIEARFRVTGRVPEIWRADSGAAEPVSYRTDGEHTVVPLELGAEDSLFVVFRKPAAVPAATIVTPPLAPLGELGGPWSVRFQPGRGAPVAVTLPALAPLNEHATPGVKYFSGVATYRKAFKLPPAAAPGRPLWLDLGAVGDVATVRVNGRAVGTAWHAPWRIDIGQAVRRGENTLEIEVANLWVNRLVGDAQPGAEKVTFTTMPTYRPDAPLRPSGLIGPVRLLQASGPR